jgi:CrcB protein
MTNGRPLPGHGFLVAAGGFCGAIARYGVDVGVGVSLSATFVVNAVGSLVLAVVLSGWLDGDGSDRARRFAATGFLSSFTTFSTFVIETVQADLAVAVGYVLLTYAVGFAAAGVGLAIGERRVSES